MTREDVTARVSADTLGGMVALVERHALQPDNLREWYVAEDPTASARMTVGWATLGLVVRSRGDLRLAQAIARERIAGRQAVDKLVVLARRELGWGRGAPLVRCLVCRTSAVAAEQHAPGSRECYDTREERRIAHSD